MVIHHIYPVNSGLVRPVDKNKVMTYVDHYVIGKLELPFL